MPQETPTGPSPNTPNVPNRRDVGPLPLDYQPQRRWWDPIARRRASFSRHNLLDGLKTLGWVIPLAVLIWIYAEREQISRKSFTIPITATSNDPTRVVTLVSPQEKKLVLELEGPQARLDKIEELLVMARGEANSLPIEIDSSLPPGRHDLQTLAQLASQSLFKDNAVTVKSVQPQLLEVQVDEIAEQWVDVQADPEIKNLEPTTSFEPRQVAVRGPKQKLQALGKDLKVYAELANRPELKKIGPQSIDGVPLALPPALRSDPPRHARHQRRPRQPGRAQPGRAIPDRFGARVRARARVHPEEIRL